MADARDLSQTGSNMIAGRRRSSAPSDISPSEDTKCRLLLDLRLVQPMRRDDRPKRVVAGVPKKKQNYKKIQLHYFKLVHLISRF